MIPTLPPCPRCGSRRLIRFGIVAGKQRRRCKRCRYQFTRPDGHAGTHQTRGGQPVRLRSVLQHRGPSATAQSVLRWVCGYVDHHCTKPPPGEAVVIELDEMWHFLQRKDNKVWIWKAYDRATRRLVDWECGDERTFRRLFERLSRWKVRLFCSDSYVVYPLVLAVGGHYQGKGETVALERNNGQQRHAALRRRSIVVSKSLAMIERRVALFAHLHVNKEAAPEMYRLPIQAGGFIALA